MYKMKFTAPLSIVLTTFMAFSLSACNGGGTVANFLSKMDVAVVQNGADEFVQLDTQFHIGNVSLSELTVPIPDPKTLKSIGTVTFSQLPNGDAQIQINVNVNVITKGNADLGMTLPNGNPVPLVLGAKRGDMLGVPFMTNSMLYVGGDLKKTTYIGVALGVPGMAQVMSQLESPANIFFSYTFGQVLAVGGIYGSPTATQNGVAVFGKYTAPGTAAAVVDEENQDMNQFDAKTQRKLMDFFYGEKRELNFY